MTAFPDRIEVVDSHTEGEPTRVVVSGWPELSGATMEERRLCLAREHDALRRAVVCEPRGNEAMVGALLTPPVSPDSIAGVVFFNNTGTLGMCGHGLIGLARTLAHLGRLEGAEATIDTPVGTVGVRMEDDGAVSIANVPAYVHARDVVLDVPGFGRVTGDVAWGGNWFFLCELADVALSMANLRELTETGIRIRRALEADGVTGEGGAEIDHIELFGPPSRPDADSRNFVLCPGLAYDRSPCGTGTSAKLAVLANRGKLAPGVLWRQESITGSMFTGWYERRDGLLYPYIKGHAYVTAHSTLVFDARDPFREGIPAE